MEGCIQFLGIHKIDPAFSRTMTYLQPNTVIQSLNAEVSFFVIQNKNNEHISVHYCSCIVQYAVHLFAGQ